MIRILLIYGLLNICGISYGQQNAKISTIDFVQIVNGNMEEATFYYENNWRILRNMAVEKEYIHSYQVLETPTSDDAPFQLMLITTYLNEEQYTLREDHFSELIKEKGELQLMNEKKPEEFRKTLFNKEMVRHWN